MEQFLKRVAIQNILEQMCGDSSSIESTYTLFI